VRLEVVVVEHSEPLSLPPCSLFSVRANELTECSPHHSSKARASLSLLRPCTSLRSVTSPSSPVAVAPFPPHVPSLPSAAHSLPLLLPSRRSQAAFFARLLRNRSNASFRTQRRPPSLEEPCRPLPLSSPTRNPWRVSRTPRTGRSSMAWLTQSESACSSSVSSGC
jgi:hypothetical protein